MIYYTWKEMYAVKVHSVKGGTDGEGERHRQGDYYEVQHKGSY